MIGLIFFDYQQRIIIKCFIKNFEFKSRISLVLLKYKDICRGLPTSCFNKTSPTTDNVIKLINSSKWCFGYNAKNEVIPKIEESSNSIDILLGIDLRGAGIILILFITSLLND